MMYPYYAIVYFTMQFLIALLGRGHAIVAYGAIASDHRLPRADLYSVPCLRQARLVVLGMAQGLSGFSFYKVVAAATLNVLSHVLANYYTQLVKLVGPFNMVQDLAVVDLLVLVNIYILFKIPTMTHSLFTGGTGGHGVGSACDDGISGD